MLIVARWSALLAAAMALTLWSAAAHAQGTARIVAENTVAADFTGVHIFRVPNKKTYFEVKLRKGSVLSVTAVNQLARRTLTAGGGTMPSNGCPCGHTCWEDHVEMVSVCVCKTCGGGGSGGGSLKLLATVAM